MSQLENRVQPLLQPLVAGDSGTLDMGGQAVIATWAVKTAMVLEGMDPIEKRGYSQYQRECLRSQEAIPWRTSIWLAASADPDWFMSTKIRHTGETLDDISGVSITMVFARAVLQILTIQVPGDVGPTTEVTTDVRQGSWGQLTIQIWPPRTGARWPPPMWLKGETGLDALADRFRTVDSSRTEMETLSI